MLLACTCGRMFRVPDGAPPVRRDCPVCGAILRDASTGIAQEDLRILKEKERALRDALRQRERSLRQAQIQISTLKTELDRLRSGSPQSADAQRELDILRDESGQQIRALEERVHTLECELARQGTPPRRPPSEVPVVLAAPTRIERAAEWKPMELPSDRLDLALGTGVDERVPEGMGRLPSDRVPLFEEIPLFPASEAPSPLDPAPAPLAPSGPADPAVDPFPRSSAEEGGVLSPTIKRRG